MSNISEFAQKFFPSFSIDQILSSDTLEKIILDSGLNDEILNEQPQELRDYFGTGYGLKIWQYPNQFVPYLLFLSKYAPKIHSYLEIGCRHGGTFIFTNEFINAVNGSKIRSIACDMIDAPTNIIEYTQLNNNAEYFKFNSHSVGFLNFISDKSFSLVLVDADHSYDGVKKDTELVLDKTNILVLHDIVNSVCPGVVKYWNELKTEYSSLFDFYEFTNQYSSVNGSFLGIGCAVKKNFHHDD